MRRYVLGNTQSEDSFINYIRFCFDIYTCSVVGEDTNSIYTKMGGGM